MVKTCILIFNLYLCICDFHISASKNSEYIICAGFPNVTYRNSNYIESGCVSKYTYGNLLTSGENDHIFMA